MELLLVAGLMLLALICAFGGLTIIYFIIRDYYE